jgi:hypothetical protein
MSTLIDFAPSSTAVFRFLAQLADGNQYNISCPWNAFGERWYITVSDLSGTVIIHRAIAQSGPAFRAALTWEDGVATVTLTSAHNVPVASLANMRISQTNGAFDGLYQALSTGPQTLTFQLPVNPNVSGPVTGKLDFPLDLLAGYGIGSLYYHADTAQFEF